MLVSAYHKEKTDWPTIDAVKTLTLELIAKIERVVRAAVATVLCSLGFRPVEQKEETPPPPPAVVLTPPTMLEKTWDSAKAVSNFVCNHKGKIAICSIVILGLALAILHEGASEPSSYDPLSESMRRYERECPIDSKQFWDYLSNRAICKNPYYPIRNLTSLRRPGCKPPDPEPDF